MRLLLDYKYGNNMYNYKMYLKMANSVRIPSGKKGFIGDVGG